MRVRLSETLLFNAASQILNPNNGHLYEFDNTGRKTMKKALQASQSIRQYSDQYYMGHLLTITSQAEFDFVREKVGVLDPWIALSYMSAEGDWRWIDGPEAGLPSSWFKWSTGEPTGGTDQLCVFAFAAHEWFDESCGAEHTVVIEYEIQSSISGTITVEVFGINPNWSFVWICCLCHFYCRVFELLVYF